MMILYTLRQVRAIWCLGIWLVVQLFFAASGAPGVAWWAHIGGFIIGAAMAALHRSTVRRRLAALEAPVS